MRIFRLLLAALAALIALALLAAWQIPGRLDWNRYRGTIEALASVTLGRPVTIAGPITLSLLPETEITAADVVVAGDAPGEQPGASALTVKALRLRVAPLPLLAGRVAARELALNGPDMSVGWPLRHGELAGWPPYWLSAFSARIEKGRLQIGKLVLDQIDATLETTEAGGLISVGKGEVSGQPIRFSARLTAVGADGASGINLTVAAQDRLAGVTGGFFGQLAADGGLAGRIDIGGPDLAQVIAPPGATTPGATTPGPTTPASAFKFGAVVKADANQALFNDLTLDVTGPGGTTALNGSATLQLAPELRLDAKLATPRLEADPFVSLLGRAGQAGLTIGLDLKADAVPLGGGLMRAFSIVLEAARGQIALHRLAVRLPNEADLSLDGVMQYGDTDRPRFDGNLHLAAPRLREMLRWLDGAGMRLLPDLPEAVLASTDFRAHAVAEPGSLALDRIEGLLDGAAVNGELRLWPRTPAIVASLELAKLDLDPWLAEPPARPAETGRGFDVDLRLRATTARLHGEEIRAVLLDAALQALPRAPDQPGVLPGGSAGRVTLRQLEATIRGVHLVASGTVGSGGRLTEGKLQATTNDASSLAELLPPAWRPAEAFWRGPVSLNAQLAGPADALGLKLTVDMADARLEAQPVIDLRGGKWSGPLTLRHPGASRLLGLMGLSGSEAWLGEGSLSVVAQLSGGQGPIQPNIAAPDNGSQAASVQLFGGPRAIVQVGRIGAEVLDLTAGQMRLAASFGLDLAGDVPSLTGRIQADRLTFPAPLWRDTKPLPFALLRGWRASLPVTARQLQIGRGSLLTQAAGSFGLADGILRIGPVTATLQGGALSGTLVVNTALEPPTLALTAALADATAIHSNDPAEDAAALGGMPLGLLAGQVNAAADLTAAGHSPAAMLVTLAGGMKLDVTQGVLSGFDLFRVTRTVAAADPHARAAAEAALRVALGDGVTNFDRLAIAAEAQSGTLTLRDSTMTATAGNADISGSVELDGHGLDVRILLHPAIEPPPELAIRLAGPWEKPRRSVELAGFLRWLGEHRADMP